MQFIVIAYYGKDEKAVERRMAVRKNHLEMVKEMFESGKWLYAVGIRNDEGVPIGSVVVCNFLSRKELEEQWLKREPYYLGKVWEKIEIKRAEVAVHQ